MNLDDTLPKSAAAVFVVRVFPPFLFIQEKISLENHLIR